VRSMKGVSSIFSSLIVTAVTLFLAVPLFLYFNSLYHINTNYLSSSFNNLQNAINTQISVIKLGNWSNETYIYNYGNVNLTIQEVIIGHKVFKVNFNISPNEIVELSQLIGDYDLGENTTIIMQINGNYYYYS